MLNFELLENINFDKDLDEKELEKIDELYSTKVLMKKVWKKKLKADKSFIKINLMLARVFFGTDVENDYFVGVKNERFEKLKLLVS